MLRLGTYAFLLISFFVGCSEEPRYKDRPVSEWIRLSHDTDSTTQTNAIKEMVSSENPLFADRLREVFNDRNEHISLRLLAYKSVQHSDANNAEAAKIILDHLNRATDETDLRILSKYAHGIAHFVGKDRVRQIDAAFASCPIPKDSETSENLKWMREALKY